MKYLNFSAFFVVFFLSEERKDPHKQCCTGRYPGAGDSLGERMEMGSRYDFEGSAFPSRLDMGIVHLN